MKNDERVSEWLNSQQIKHIKLDVYYGVTHEDGELLKSLFPLSPKEMDNGFLFHRDELFRLLELPAENEIKSVTALKKGLGEVTLEIDGFASRFRVRCAGHVGKEFRNLTNASNHVWCLMKGYTDEADYLKKSGEKRVTGGAGWKFWGLTPETAPIVNRVLSKAELKALPDGVEILWYADGDEEPVSLLKKANVSMSFVDELDDDKNIFVLKE